MKTSVVLWGPQGSGKSTIAPNLIQALGLSKIVESDEGQIASKNDCLVITTLERHAELIQKDLGDGVTVLAIGDAKRLLEGPFNESV